MERVALDREKRIQQICYQLRDVFATSCSVILSRIGHDATVFVFRASVVVSPLPRLVVFVGDDDVCEG